MKPAWSVVSRPIHAAGCRATNETGGWTKEKPE